MDSDQIPFVDVAAQYASLHKEIDAAIARVLESGQYILGPETDAFEEEFANACATRHAVGVNSGTSALYLSLVAAGVGHGDEVITVPFSFEATAAAVRSAGASVRFVDVDPQSLTMDAQAFEREITDRTRAVIPVHLFGQAADMDPIRDVARRHSLVVIEDACQAHGGTYKGQPVGGLGNLGCFSFYPTKNLATCGEGGMIVTNDPALAEAARSLRSWGPVARAGNYRLSAIQAAVLRVKLPHLGEWTSRRQAIAARYTSLLAGQTHTPTVMPYAGHVFNVYALRSHRRDALVTMMQSRGIGVATHYRKPIHLQDSYRDLGYQAGAFPVSEQAADEALSLPIYPELCDASVDRVAFTVLDACR